MHTISILSSGQILFRDCPAGVNCVKGVSFTMGSTDYSLGSVLLRMSCWTGSAYSVRTCSDLQSIHLGLYSDSTGAPGALLTSFGLYSTDGGASWSASGNIPSFEIDGSSRQGSATLEPATAGLVCCGLILAVLSRRR